MQKHLSSYLFIGLILLLSACSTFFEKVDTVHSSKATAAPSPLTSATTSPAQDTTTLAATSQSETPTDKTKLADFCVKELSKLPGAFDKEGLIEACARTEQLAECSSVQNSPIIHFDKTGTDLKKGKRILSIALIHGDEVPAGSVTRAWMSRLQSLDPRNTWRVLPLANPDGFKQRTRYNSRGVDLNRNFPSQDWSEKALPYWKKFTRQDRRRFPGESAMSEPETRCLVQHIKEFKPDFIISIHTPLGVLDFDGPKIGNPGFKPLPWVGLGNFPGSLGRYMWMDNKVPVLTIELRGNSGMYRLEEFDQLQDISGTVAIQSGKILGQDKANENRQ